MTSKKTLYSREWRKQNPERARLLGRRAAAKSYEKYKTDPEYRARRKEIAKKSALKNKEKNRERYLKYNREHKEQQKNWRYQTKYGITVEDYNQMLQAQRCVCAICCKKYNKNKPLHVDHDKITGEIRGLLCFSCNAAVGFLEHDVNIISKVVKYLRKELSPMSFVVRP